LAYRLLHVDDRDGGDDVPSASPTVLLYGAWCGRRSATARLCTLQARSSLRIGGWAWLVLWAFAWRLLRGVPLCPHADSLRGRRDELGMGIAGLSLFVLAEKLLPQGERLRVPVGVLLTIPGAVLIVRG